MNEHRVTISWQRNTPDFDYKRFDRSHTWIFGGGQVLQGSSAPAYHGDPAKANPEEALVAALASCQMLTFLSICALKGWAVQRYEDEAGATLAKNAQGRMWVDRIVLRPSVVFSGDKKPDRTELERLHHSAHEHCFIANSLKCQVSLEPR